MSTTLDSDIVEEFSRGMRKAEQAGVTEPTAMTVASAGQDGRLSARTVLLKQFDADGFVFYTNLESNKGRQLISNPTIAATILWREIEQQVLIEGRVELVDKHTADAYFAERHRSSQIGAWASRQSRPLDSREAFENAIKTYEKQFDGKPVPRPSYWSGFRIIPTMVEFWYGREFRLHDRFRWTLDEESTWHCQRLYP